MITDMKEHAYAHNLLQKVKKERDSYAQMITLSERERNFIVEENWIALRKSIHEKGHILDTLEQMQEEIRTFSEEWKIIMPVVEQALNDEFSQCMRELKRNMETLMSIQQQNETLLVDYNEGQKKNLRTVRQGKELTKAYSVYGENSPRSRFMDKQR